MREIVLDTETTGLDPADGHRIVEIGAIELFNHMPTGRTYHQYLNPQRAVPAEAVAIHGLTDQFLSDKPLFHLVAPAFLDFVADAKLVIHNAAFDMRFLNMELDRAGLSRLADDIAVDTLLIAKRRFPGAPASLDALCRRFGVDNSAREKHGALLDSEILAEVYLELVGGRQPDFALSVAQSQGTTTTVATWRPRPRPLPLASRITGEEQVLHDAFVRGLGEGALWLRYR